MNIVVWGGGVAVDIFPVAEAYYSIPDKIEIFNRMPNGIPSYEAKTMGNYGEPVATISRTTADSDSTAKEEEERKPIQVLPSSSIEAKILKAWEGTGEGETALNVFKCESGLNHETVGDTHLTFIHNGQVYGRSIGIAQIRTGGNEGGRVWVRGDNAEEFEEKMKNPDDNISLARKIWDGGGWSRWYNCAKRVGAIK